MIVCSTIRETYSSNRARLAEAPSVLCTEITVDKKREFSDHIGNSYYKFINGCVVRRIHTGDASRRFDQQRLNNHDGDSLAQDFRRYTYDYYVVVFARPTSDSNCSICESFEDIRVLVSDPLTV